MPHRLPRRAMLCAAVLCIFFSVLPLFAAEPAPADARLPVPESAALAEARKKAEDAFADQLKSQDEAIKKALPGQVLAQAQETPEDKPAEKYALLQLARQQGEKAGDVASVGSSLKELAAHFKVDALQLTIASVGALSRTKADPAELFDLYADLAASAAEAGDLPQVNRALAPAEGLLIKIEDKSAAKALRARAESLRAAARIAPLRQKLADNPDDPDANHDVGWYLATKAEDWAAALPLLAKSKDADIKALAQAELAAPATPDAQFDLAEKWWKFSEGKKALGSDNEAIKRHAGEWYSAAQPEMKGLNSKTIESRLAAINALSGRASSTVKDLRGLKFEWFDGENFEKKVGERIDHRPSLYFHDGTAGTGGSSDHFSVRWSGFVRAPKPGKYRFFAIFDDAMRLKINGKVVIEGWDLANRHEMTAFVEFTDEPQELVLEFRERQGLAYCLLFWTPPGETYGSNLPATAFFQTKDAAKSGNIARRAGTGLSMTLYGDADFKKEIGRLIDDKPAWRIWIDQCGIRPGPISITWRGYIAPPEAGVFRFSPAVEGMSITIDRKKIMEFENAAKWATAELTEEPHEIFIEYRQPGTTGGFTLFWDKPGSFQTQPVPPQVFFTDRAAAARAISERKKADKK